MLRSLVGSEMCIRDRCHMVGMRTGGGVLVHCMGADALAAFSVAAQVMDLSLIHI